MNERRAFRGFLRCAVVAAALGIADATWAQTAAGPAGAAAAGPVNNVIIFVADGLRHGAVDTGVMPTFAEVRTKGVNFVNSHSLMPTVTTVNASAIATGHLVGDTGNFSNNIFTGRPSTASDNYSVVANAESNQVLHDLVEQFSGNYLGEESLLAAARRAGYNTAAIGKLGPVMIQDVTQNNGGLAPEQLQTVVIDDGTGTPGALALLKPIRDRIVTDPYMLATYFENQAPTGDPRTAARGANNNAGTRVANVAQQKYLMDAVTHAVLPAFTDPKGNHKPFVMVYWSRDPDGTQHNEGDSENKLVPGINGPTVKLAFENADNNLRDLLAYLKATPDPNRAGKMLSDTTNIFITSDHGFGTANRKFMNAGLATIDCFASRQVYRDVAEGDLPQGFLAIELAHDLELPLFDAAAITPSSTPQAQIVATLGPAIYRQLRVASTDTLYAEHPTDASAMIGGTGLYDREGYTSEIVVSASGGADLIYLLPHRDREGLPAPVERGTALARKIVGLLATKPFISGNFVDAERYGEIPGALALSDIGLRGSSRTPTPAIAVSFRNFSTDPENPFMTGCEIVDAGYATGRGMHGSFGRHDTYNCMMAMGPDFKSGLADNDPVSNADIAMTLARVLKLDLLANARGTHHGRVITEALASGGAPKGTNRLTKTSTPAANGVSTVLLYQTYTDEAGMVHQYFDAAGFPGAAVGIPK